MIRTYQISLVSFSVIWPDDLMINEEEPFFSFEVKGKGEFTFICQSGFPELPEDAELYYSDSRNLVYRSSSAEYRYIGNFQMKDKELESQSCVVCEMQHPEESVLYLPRVNHVTSLQMLFSRMGLEQTLARFHHIILHSSFIIHQGKGIVFTAPSGTGKSTQADLWETCVPGTEIINGDRSVLSIRNDQPYVSGIPFCGSSGISKKKEAPLSAVVVLRQGKENQIRKLSGMEAVRLLYGECSVNIWDQRGVENILSVLEKIIEVVPVYYYACRKDKTAVKTLYHTLYRERIE